jgi:hypothetical protein
MRLLRLLPLSLIALAIAVPSASAQTVVPMPGGGQAKIKLPATKGKGKKKTPARTHLVQVGIADQKTSMFTDPRFLSLGLKTARRSVAWDTFQYDWQIPEVDQWLQAARAAGVKPIITFARSREQSRIQLIPTRAQWLAGFKEFRKRYPWVTDFVASNESNHTPPTVKRPELAASYYKDMRLACRTCRIAAATINELPLKSQKPLKTSTWVKRFIKAARHQPKYWALHNYYGANTFSTKGTKQFLKMVKGQVWVTETGGLVKRRSGNFAGKIKMREGLAHSTKAWRFIFDNMLTLSPRITKVFLYHWDSSSVTDTWDSALVGSDGRARGGLAVLKAKLARRR